MKKYVKAVLVTVLVLAIAIGFFGKVKTSKSIPDPTRETTERNLQDQWLLGKLCSPPCWAGIVPGKTTVDEAFELLNNLPEAENINRFEYNIHGELYWDWVGENNSGGRIFLMYPNL